MNNGVVLALLAYACFAWGDGFIKGTSGTVGVFEISFYTMLFTAIFLYFARPAGERWRDFWRAERPIPVHARAFIGLITTLLCVFAFGTIPLAETYALLFAGPLFITILSVIFLKEAVGPWRWFAVVAGFVGVILVVRPGFRDLQLGHFAAILAAFLAATNMILLRSIAGKEKQTTVFGTLIVYGLIGNGVLVLATSDAIPSLPSMTALATIGMLAAAGHTLMFRAARLAPANQIAPTHYSQIFWAILIGAFFFGEYPDAFSFIGLAVIVASGLLTLIRERIRLGTVRWTPFTRGRL